MKRFGIILSVLACQLMAAGRLHAAWQFSNSGTSQNLNGVYFVDSSTGWAVGAAGTIIKTEDAGGSWSAQTSGVATNIQDVKFVGTSTGISVGSSGLILRTTDAITWQSMNNRGDVNSLFGVSWSVSTGVVWAVGAAGTVRVSTDSGAFWNNGNPNGDIPAAQNLRSIFFVSAATGIVVGDAGTLYRTGNGGISWVNISTGATQNLRDVFFVGPSTGFIVGASGVIRKTMDAGISWTSVSSTSTNFNAVHFVSTDTGWAVGEAGIVVASTDSGNSFFSEASSATVDLNDVYFVSASLGFAVGNSGTIIKSVSASSLVSTSTPGTGEKEGSLTPMNNIFDPSQGQAATIRYYFKKSGWVSIKVYTLQGRLVRTLLNEQRAAGVYQDVFWDGRNDAGELVAPGIYLVHVEAPNFSDSKKMAVIR